MESSTATRCLPWFVVSFSPSKEKSLFIFHFRQKIMAPLGPAGLRLFHSSNPARDLRTPSSLFTFYPFILRCVQSNEADIFQLQLHLSFHCSLGHQITAGRIEWQIEGKKIEGWLTLLSDLLKQTWQELGLPLWLEYWTRTHSSDERLNRGEKERNAVRR